jgi:hypothetical protein
MARYKQIDTSPRFIAVDLDRQLHPGTFEHALNYLIDHRLDVSRFDARYKNDVTGASAYPPAMLLKVILFAYSRGIVRSRDIARACTEHVSDHPEDRKGAKGKIIKSNRTDNQSAKMATSKGVIQGYTGVAAVDDKHQIIVEAQAHGTGSEQALLMPMVEAASSLCTPDTLITADAGYHSDANLKALAEQDRPALIADNQMRKRDERFKDQVKHKAQPDPLYDKAHPKKSAGHYRPKDFDYDPEAGTCVCPAGKLLYQNGSNCNHNGHLAVKFQGALRDCGPCALRDKCLRKPDVTKTRQVSFFHGKAPGTTLSYSDRMKRAIDSERGRRLYGGRFATVEPVFANLRHNKGLDRFTLRGQKKVDTQWKLFCLVHNIEKLAHHGYGQ